MHKKPILYVEDNDDDIFFMRRAFSDAGVENELIALSSGEHAMDYLATRGQSTRDAYRQLPCLILLDLNMPGKSGFEVLAWLRGQLQISTLPVLVLTSSNHDTDIERAYKEGANAYLLKPAAPENLVDILKIVRDFWLSLNQLPPYATNG